MTMGVPSPAAVSAFMFPSRFRSPASPPALFRRGLRHRQQRLASGREILDDRFILHHHSASGWLCRQRPGIKKIFKRIGKVGKDVKLLLDCEKLLTDDEMDAVSNI